MTAPELIRTRMTADDLKQLSDIYAPKEVATPDRDPWFGLCVTRDGKIRFYGEYGKKNVFDEDAPECYIESTDGGLSWKRHICEKETLGASVYVPFMDRYARVLTVNRNLVFRFGNDPDDSNFTEILIADTGYIEPRKLVVLQKQNRLLFCVHERRAEIRPSAKGAYYTVIFYSDDCGQTWGKTAIPAVPFHEITYPHKGYRWQQNAREGTVAELSDGRLWLILRTATDYHWQCFSADGGITWSEPTPSPFHGTGTMPQFLPLSDGRLLFFWCNTLLMPEVANHGEEGEDYFTNRDANHVAVSEDDGRTWHGFREMTLNPLRHNPDFRSAGGPECDRDKSVHQFEGLELPCGKILVVYGQHYACRRIAIFDLRWLYETSRTEDFLHGMANISAQAYLQSIPDGHKGPKNNPNSFAGHCAYNRIPSAFLLPSPRNDGHEALFVGYNPNHFTVSRTGGAVWNFPMMKKGSVTARLHLTAPVRLSLTDVWRNPTDDTVQYYADYSVLLTPAMQADAFTDFTVTFDTESNLATLTAPNLSTVHRLHGDHPHGLCYLILQSVNENPETGAYIERLEARTAE